MVNPRKEEISVDVATVAVLVVVVVVTTTPPPKPGDIELDEAIEATGATGTMGAMESAGKDLGRGSTLAKVSEASELSGIGINAAIALCTVGLEAWLYDATAPVRVRPSALPLSPPMI